MFTITAKLTRKPDFYNKKRKLKPPPAGEIKKPRHPYGYRGRLTKTVLPETDIRGSSIIHNDKSWLVFIRYTRPLRC